MRISDWSSDVCSSDLHWQLDRRRRQGAVQRTHRAGPVEGTADHHQARSYGGCGRLCRGMGAEDEADGQPGGVLRHLAAPGLGRRDQAQEGPSPKGRSVNFLLDTNVVSEWVKPQPNAGVIAWLAEVDEDRVFLSVVTLAEIRHGIEIGRAHV